MNGAQLRLALEHLFGSERWRRPAFEWLGVNESTLDRWVNGQIEPPGPVVAAVEARTELERYRHAARKAHARRIAGRFSESQLEVLRLVAAGFSPRLQPPTPHGLIMNRDRTIHSCVRRGWLESFKNPWLTDAGRTLLEETS